MSSDNQYAMQNPLTQYPQPEFPKQPQEAPGLAQVMEPRPDHGETSYKGFGRLAGRKALITGADSGIGRATAIAYAREGADLVLNYKSDDIPAKVKEFTGGQGVNVWYETQREQDFVKTVDLLAKRGRMIVMAGRTAQPIFPVGPFYVKDCSLFGFAMFNATTEEQRRCAEDISRWLAEKKLRIPVGKTFKLDDAAAAHRFLEENTVGKAGTLTAPAWRRGLRPAETRVVEGFIVGCGAW